MSQVHKEQLTEIENALPNRAGLDVEIFGMEGVPQDVLQSHQQRVAAQFQQAETERQAATAHRAKRAEAATGESSGEGTPVGAGQSVSTPTSYVQPSVAAPVAVAAAPAPAPQYSYPPPYAGAPVAAPYQQTASPGFQPFSPIGGQPAPGAAPYPPTGYSPQPFPGQPSTPGYGATPPPFPQQQSTSTDSNTPPRAGSLPIPTGLPQRPAFGAPSVNAQQMQQMHMGHPLPAAAPGYSNGDVPAQHGQHNQSVDELISGAAKEAAATPTEKSAKKDKSKNVRMIYSDETTSPEEKMARLPRYVFARNEFAQETALGELPGSVVVGTIRDQDTVVDPAH
ncbi:hypothetical protein N7462_007090 [Penicillium macrosclerotiorum]|uniref:uncharacterized protein n=1 Tax=Penicillium macrosclerotiorum TaxID=303699 RepID=UPI0025495ABD|nr:uncharacterized protein N7462_007090 [Penicillium macrosclerotiorum]KAJ5678846.1 hypothetical protein N7462_007090 [Penicillium macrosclerotiorum]